MKQKKNITNTVYIFKVVLPTEFEEDEIWRMIAVRPTNTLDAFHRIIFRAFDRVEEHMWSFFSGKPYKKGTMEYSSHINDDIYEDKKPTLASKVKLLELPLRKKDKYYYLFDYGDEWWHEIRFLGEREAEPGKRYPKILKRCGDSPLQYPDEDDWNENDDRNEFFSMGNMDLDREVTFKELEQSLNQFKNSLDASEVAGYMRGIVAAKHIVIPSSYFQLFTGIDELHTFESIEQLQEFTNVFCSLNNRFVSELTSDNFERFKCEHYGDSLEDLMKRVEDMRAEIRGFLRGLDLGQSDPADMDEDGKQAMEQLAELDALLENIVRSKVNFKKNDDAALDGLHADLSRMDEILFDLFIRASISFSSERLDASGMFPGIPLEQVVLNSEFTPYSVSSAPKKYMDVGRNDPCPCGSGKKYKKCCLLKVN